MTTGQKIARLRRERGMTQDGLADALGVSRQIVPAYRRGLSL
ncbi:MAG TPA: helix-turn-helix domain-containing protein [Candidatus Borkfalkia stercoripullorum]|nr:helix-turn-helix domain-containing protein [Candidatus Borkfalkia stercoripullorum]